MTVPIQDPIVSYVANGVTTGPFAFPFRILVADDLRVLYNDAIADASTYVISGIGDDEGSVTFFTLPPMGTSIIVYRQVALERTNDYQFNGDLRAVTVNADFDRIWMALQDVGDTASRSIHYPTSEIGIDGTLPSASNRANKVLAFDSNGFQSLVPLPSSLGAGDMHDELGSDGTAGFKPGVDFTVGVSTSLQLSRAYGTKANLFVDFDASTQGANTFALNDQTLTFDGPLPNATVFVKGGTTLSVYVPPDGSVTDAKVALGTKLYNRSHDTISLMDFPGIVGDDVNDDTAALNTAISVARVSGKPLYCPTPPVAYRLTSTINVGGNFAFHGDGVQPYVDNTNVTVSHTTIGKGSWFHIDHVGKGFSAVGATQAFSVTYKGIGTIRNQPTPNGAAAFTPAANDYDFYNDNADLFMDDVFCLNPTKFSYTTGGGRAVYRRIRGQPLQKGIYTDTAYDVCRYDNIHFWPWWSQAQGVYAYTLANANAFTSARNDNPLYSNIFTYGYFAGLAITHNANGDTSRGSVSNWDSDYTNYGVFVDNSASGATLVFSNFKATGYGPGANSAVFTAGSTCELRFSNFHASYFGGNGVRLSGTSNFAWFNNSKVQQWNLSNVGFAAFDAETTNQITFDGPLPFCVAPTGTPTIIGGGGTFVGITVPGQTTLTTDVNGLVTVNHNIGAIPLSIIATPQSTGAALTAQVVDGSLSATSFVIQFRTASTNSPLASASIKFNYVLHF